MQICPCASGPPERERVEMGVLAGLRGSVSRWWLGVVAFVVVLAVVVSPLSVVAQDSQPAVDGGDGGVVAKITDVGGDPRVFAVSMLEAGYPASAEAAAVALQGSAEGSQPSPKGYKLAKESAAKTPASK